MRERRELPRRCYLDLHTPEEQAISLAIALVENLGCDERLTSCVVLLGEARDKLSDFVDDQKGD